MHQAEFSFQRSRGIVWVCDLADSSKYLNDNSTAADLETFLPRLHWLGMIAVKAAGGVFLKWTGDGFLGWIETPLHRELTAKSTAVFEAIWHISLMVNVTQLGVSTKKRFKLRHGVAFENDALLTTITNQSNQATLDITGRAVVLAFRLSGIPAAFPGATAESELLEAAKEEIAGLHSKRWVPSPDELLRYFKGERWGTNKLSKTVRNRPRKGTVKSVVKNSHRVISDFETGKSSPPEDSAVRRFIKEVYEGPQWAKDALLQEAGFVQSKVVDQLKSLHDFISSKKPTTAEERKLFVQSFVQQAKEGWSTAMGESFDPS